MNYYISENLNRLAANRYLEELFIKGRLQTQYENDPNNSPTSKFYRQEFDQDLMSFVVKYPDFKFNDFVFMRDLENTLTTDKNNFNASQVWLRLSDLFG